ncbi:hypothetical protein, partial [Actinoplanes nipponensis]
MSHDAGADVLCRHCRRALWHEDLWGWLHLDNSYLCRHPDTGEILFTPAEPAAGSPQRNQP